MPFTIEKPLVNFLLRLAGVLLTVFAIVGSIDSIGLLLGGIEHRSPWPILFGVGSLCADLGIAGAWLRISRKYEHLSMKRVQAIRRLLWAGVLGGSLLAIGTLGMFSPNPNLSSLAGVFIGLSALGALLIKQTPQSS